MKKIVIVFLLLPMLMKAQDSISRPRLGLTFGISSAPSYTYGWTPGISFTAGKHEANASLIIVNTLYNSGKTYFGFQGGYRFYPNGQNARLSLLFGYDFAYFAAKYERPDSSNRMGTTISTLSQSLKVIQNYFSFGFRINILRNLFIAPSFGIGIGNRETVTYNYFPNRPISDYHKINSTYAILGNVTITYHFIALRRK